MKFIGREDGEYLLYDRGGWKLINIQVDASKFHFRLELPLNQGMIHFSRVEREFEGSKKKWFFYDRNKRFLGTILEPDILPTDLKVLFRDINYYMKHASLRYETLSEYLKYLEE